MEQPIITRARAKLNNVNKLVEETKQLRKRQTTLNIKKNVESSVRKSAKEYSDAKVTFGKSEKKKTTQQKFKSIMKKDKNKVSIQEDENMLSNKSNKNEHSNNIILTEVTSDRSHSNNLEDLDINETSKKLQQKNTATNINLSSNIITPKSTPIQLIVSLTPHRSTKTPKKSPISLDSPKTHSIATKLLKIPRKLSLTPEENLEKSSNIPHKILQKTKKVNLNNMLISDKNISQIKNKRSKFSISSNKIIHKFPKSPKIVLRSPRSKKSKSRKSKVLSPSEIIKMISKKSQTNRISDTTLEFNTKQSPKMNTQEGSSTKRKNLTSFKYHLLNSKLIKILTSSQIKDILSEPIVLLEKLSLESMFTKFNKNQSDTLISAENSFKILIPPKMRTSELKSDMSVKDIHSSVKSMKTSDSELPLNIKQNISIESINRLSIPLMSSTPQKEKEPLVDGDSIFNMSIAPMYNTYNIRSKYKNQSDIHMQLSNAIDEDTDVKNGPKVLALNNSVKNDDQIQFSIDSKQNIDNFNENVTILKKNQKNKKDITYEIENETMLEKEQENEKNITYRINDAQIENVKKAHKIQFNNLISDKNNVRKSISKSTRSQLSTSNVGDTQKNTIINTINESNNIKTSKCTTPNLLVSSVKSKSSRMSNGVALNGSHNFNKIPSVSLNRIQTTPQTLILTEKKSAKKSSVKKVPNFRRIHEKLFAKSESLVDGRKRLENRYLLFSANKVLAKIDEKKIKPSPSDTSNGTYNRFGFKLRKANATHVMLKKQTVFSREKQKEETRTVLKGVRTNRRFELQMKARNLNT